jgi:hypothetical protein
MPNTGADILNSQSRMVIPNDLAERETFVEKLKNALHRDAGACDTRLPEVHPWVDNDPVHRFAHLPRFPTKVLYSTLTVHAMAQA